MRFAYLASSLLAVSAVCFVGCSSDNGGGQNSNSPSDMSSPSSSSQDTSNSSQSGSHQRAYSHDNGTYHPMTDNTGKYPQAPQENVRTTPDNQQGQ